MQNPKGDMAADSDMSCLCVVIQERNLACQTQDEEDMKKRVDQLSKSTVDQAHRRKEMNVYQEALVRLYICMCG